MQARKDIAIEMRGVGILQGYGNADPYFQGDYHQNTVQSFEGRAQAVIRAGFDAGEIRVKFRAEGCQEVETRIICVRHDEKTERPICILERIAEMLIERVHSETICADLTPDYTDMTGYLPNPSEVAVADTWHDPYTVLGNPHVGDESYTSFRSKISCILKVWEKKDQDHYIVWKDEWRIEDFT